MKNKRDMLPKVGKFIFLSGVLLLAAALMYSAYYKLPGAVWGAISFILCLGTGTAFFRPLPRTENKTPSEVREKALFVRLSGQKRFFVNANKCAPGDRAKVVSKNGKFYVYAGGMIIGTLSASNAKKISGKKIVIYSYEIFGCPDDPKDGEIFTVTVKACDE